VLLLGASGTGKELVARAIHALSESAARPLVARNSATLPEGLVSAELFGSARNFPNAGLPERAGLVGQAHGSTLFLDEFGELPGASQAQLLRVMDDGEYQRLGEAVTRRADLRVIAATNRPETALKHDVLARFPFRIRLPDLNHQREDIPLIAHHLLTQLACAEPSLHARFGSNVRGDGLKVSLSLMRALVAHRYTTNVRELEYFLRQSAAKSAGSRLELPTGAGLEALPELAPDFDADVAPSVDPGALTREQILTVLAGQGWVQQKAWRALGLSSRYALVRLMKKHRIRSLAADADDASNE
jgi:two-component system nitrogen regulation response regulator GlnG/two-component system response regulator HydG